MSSKSNKIPVGISSCLIGERVRFDGGHKLHSYIVNTLGQFFSFSPICPEVGIGMTTPRAPIRLIVEEGESRCVGVKEPELDVTKQLSTYAEEMSILHEDLCGYIFKKDSPSCGMERVKRYKNDSPTRDGVGIYAKRFMELFPLLPVEEEGRLGDPVLRENFVNRIFIYHEWRRIEPNITLKCLMDFHAKHKYGLFSHNQDMARQLGKKLASSKKTDVKDFSKEYIQDFMTILKIPATRKNHVNVLQHILGYLKNDLSSDDKKELVESIESYRLGQIPLIVPITLLRHFFRKHPDDYILNSYYMHPYPAELKLQNSI